MKIENSFRVDLPVSRAWATLLDIPGIVTCMPGAELLGVDDERSYRGQVKVKLGPVAVAFKGRVQLTEVDETQHQVRAKAAGTEEKGRGSAQADVSFRLTPDGAGTRVDVETNLTLAGAVAQYGRAQGVIADVSKMMIDSFATNLQDRIGAGKGAPAAGEPNAQLSVPALSMFSILAAVIRGWFSRSKGSRSS